MQRQNLIILVIAVAAAGTAAGIWWIARPSGPGENGSNAAANATPVVDKPFERDQFFPTFDLNGDGAVTFEEFNAVYSTWGADKRFSRGPGQPGLAAREAFDFFDMNRDGSIDAEDVRFALDEKWAKFAEQTRARGLTPKLHKKQWLALNNQQVDAFAKEVGALALNQLPFAGSFFDRKYFNDGRYARVTDAAGKVAEGFLSESGGRLWLVSTDARLLVFRPDAVDVKEMPAAPALEYIKTVAGTPFDDPQANLKLGQRCVELGLKVEAGAIFTRVLIFDPTNAAALEALNLRLENERFVPRNE